MLYFHCSGCKCHRHRDEFTRSQCRKPASVRKCRECAAEKKCKLHFLSHSDYSDYLEFGRSRALHVEIMEAKWEDDSDLD